MTDREESSQRSVCQLPHSFRANLRLLVAVIVMAVLSSGCAVTQRMAINDLGRMKVDCANKDAQIRFLESQMTTPDERMAAALGMNVFSELFANAHGEKTQFRSMVDREYDALAKRLIWDLRTHCPSTQIAGTKVSRR